MSGTKQKHGKKIDVVESFMAGFVVVLAPSNRHTINRHSFDHEKVSAMAFFLTKTPISFEFDMLAVFCKLFQKHFVNFYRDLFGGV